MAPAERPLRAELVELALVVAAFSVLTLALFYPMSVHLGTLGYEPYIRGDAQYSIWNVAWVAHALITSPRHVLDANIFYPNAGTLVYSEANLAAGALAVPVYWLTKNAFAAHNSVVLLSFVLSAVGTYYLVRYIVEDRRAAAVSAIVFAYCPYVFGHLPHIQLLMTAGIPFSLLAFHRLADRPTAGRGVALGVAMGAQGLACAYYAVFVVLLIGFTVLFTAGTGPLGRSRRYWQAVAVAAVVSIAVVLPLFVPYWRLQRDTGFARQLYEAETYSATLTSYVTSSSYLWEWLHHLFATWTDQLFPGAIATAFGGAGIVVGWRARGRQRDVACLYGLVAALAFWESLGPRAYLYSLSYHLPAFSFLRAPSRFGVIVIFALAVLSGLAIAALLKRVRVPGAVAAVLVCAAVADQATGIPFTPIAPIAPVYYELARYPAGGVLEMPPLSRGKDFMRTSYMINSTAHWMPLVNAYSDFIPPAFSDSLEVLSEFPSRASFRILEADRVRYVVFDVAGYRKNGIEGELVAHLSTFAPNMRKLYGDDENWFYEIVSYPHPSD